MALTIPNLDRITKASAPTGEAFKKIQDYTAQNVAQAAGNSVVSPPLTATPPATTQASTPVTTPVIKLPPPPHNGGPNAINQL